MSFADPLTQASALLQRGAHRDARRLLEAALARDPGNADALQLLGLVQKQTGDLSAALDCLRRSVALRPHRPDFAANLANLYATLNRPVDAEAAYRAALHLDPSFRMARLGLARTLTQTGRTRDASAEAQTLIARDPGDAEAWSTLAAAHARAGETAGGIKAFERALGLRPGYGFARFGLGTLLLAELRPEAALVQFERALADGYDCAQLARGRAQALFDLGRFDAAEGVLDAAVARWPEDVDAHRLLAQLRYTRGDPGFARSLEQAIDARPRLATLPALQSDLLKRAGELERSISIARDAIERLGPSPPLMTSLALALQDEGRYDESLQWAQRVHRLAPHDAARTENVVVLMLALGRGREARPLIEDQRQRMPGDQRWLAHLATAARIDGGPEYGSLYDYTRFVRPFDLDVPAGWPSLEAFHADLLPALQARHVLQAEPLDQSLRFGTQTARSLLAETHPAIRALLTALMAGVEKYRAEIGHDAAHPYLQRNRGSVRMAGCWSVRLRRGGHHVDHVHPEGWISSAYYVHVPPEVADTNLRSGWIKFGEPKVPPPSVHAAHFVQPRAGRLVLFPSYMWHGTTPIHGDEPRVTVAFDVVPVGAAA